MTTATPHLLVLDVDGTLLDEAGRLPTHRDEPLRTASRAVPTMLATGKTWPSVAAFAARFDLAGPHLTCNGAAAVSLDGDVEVLAHLDRGVADEILAVLHDRGIATATYLADGSSVTHRRDDRHHEIARVAEAPPEVRPVPDDQAVLKILAVLRDEEEDDLRDLRADVCRIQRTGPWFLEWNDPEASKGHGLALLAARHGIDLSHAVAVGDSENDVSMFEVAGTGVAVATASEAAVAAADVHLDEDVADWFRRVADGAASATATGGVQS